MNFRPLSWRSIEHLDPDSEVHLEDALRNHERRNQLWINVDLQRPDPHGPHKVLGNGWCRLTQEHAGMEPFAVGKLTTVPGPMFRETLHELSDSLGFFWRVRKDRKKPRKVKEKVNGLYGLEVPAQPPMGEYMNRLAVTTPGRVKDFCEQVDQISADLAGAYQWPAAGAAWHWESRVPHLALAVGKVDLTNRRLHARKGPGQVGDWAGDVLRLGYSGFIPQNSSAFQQAQRVRLETIRSFGREPLDFVIGHSMDAEFIRKFGSEAGVIDLMREYRDDFCGRVIEAMDRELKRLEGKKVKLTDQAEQALRLEMVGKERAVWAAFKEQPYVMPDLYNDVPLHTPQTPLVPLEICGGRIEAKDAQQFVLAQLGQREVIDFEKLSGDVLEAKAGDVAGGVLSVLSENKEQPKEAKLPSMDALPEAMPDVNAPVVADSHNPEPMGKFDVDLKTLGKVLGLNPAMCMVFAFLADGIKEVDWSSVWTLPGQHARSAQEMGGIGDNLTGAVQLTREEPAQPAGAGASLPSASTMGALSQPGGVNKFIPAVPRKTPEAPKVPGISMG